MVSSRNSRLSLAMTAAAEKSVSRLARWYYVSAESSLTQVLVLYVPAWFPVELGHVMTLLCEVLDEHFL